MKLSQKVRYGVGCLSELAKRYGEYMDADHIATNQRIPASYAHKILQVFSNAGFVIAHKGLGYKLARPLSNITAFEVIDLLTAQADPNDSNPDLGVLLERRINRELNGISLGELLQQ